jgi:hypothetical protein
MVRNSLLGSVGFVLALLAACSEDANEGRSSNGTGGNAGTGGDGAKSAASGTASSGVSGSGMQGGATGSGGDTGGSSTGGASGNDGGRDDDGGAGVTDAGLEDAPSDAASDVTEPPTCLGRGEMCGVDGGVSCCENLGCRAGRCCVPNGTYSNCLSGADCCSGHCVLNQCTCVPRGFSCSGSGQCCSGYACVNGTCICPPDIRGC